MPFDILSNLWVLTPIAIGTAVVYITGYGFMYDLLKAGDNQTNRVLLSIIWPVSLTLILCVVALSVMIFLAVWLIIKVLVPAVVTVVRTFFNTGKHIGETCGDFIDKIDKPEKRDTGKTK